MSDLVERLRGYAQFINNAIAGGREVCAGNADIQLFLEAASRLEALEKENITLRARLTRRANDMVQMRGALIDINDELADDGDRVYFGSTNHADEFRGAVEILDAWAWTDIIGDTKAPDYIGDLRSLRAKLEALEKAAAPFVREAKNWPDYVPDDDGLFIASPDDMLPILEEHAPSGSRYGVSYSDDVVTLGDLRALAREAGEGEAK